MVGRSQGATRDKEKLKLLDLEQFLSKGKGILEKGLAESDKCPFCGSVVDFDHVKAEIERRIVEFEAIRKEFEATTSAKTEWLSGLRNVNRLAGNVKEKWDGLEVSSELADRVKKTRSHSLALQSTVEHRFQRYESIEDDPTRSALATELISLLEKRIDKVDEEVKALELSKEEKKIIDTIQTLRELQSSFTEFRGNSRNKEAFEKQIRTLAQIKDKFVLVQNDSFQIALDHMSDDIRKYYLFLHPPEKERVDDVRLRIVGDEGVEFEYAFHGKKTYPATKYLSESQQNSLGIALFLASVKEFNSQNTFFILDDVVTSFDVGHRLRLIRLLKEEFHDWQILLLTHERHWFELIKKELASEGWIICEVDCDPENGVQLRGTPEDLRALITLKLSQGFEVENDLRTLLERVLKEICNSLQIKMAFRYNDKNEERGVGELLSELRSTLNEKVPSLKEEHIFKEIETSNLLGIKGSHDRPKEVSKGDIEVALEDLSKLENLFRCDKCGHLVGKGKWIEAEKKITCKCGQKQILWKS